MSGQWFLERHGNLLGPYSLEEVRGLASTGQLRATDKVMRDGTSQLLPVSAVPELVSADASATQLPDLQVSQVPVVARPPERWNKKLLSVGVGLAVALVALAAYSLWPGDPDDEPDLSSPNLPAWFQRPHRIRAAQKKRVGIFPGLGVFNPPKNPPPPPKEFNLSWFEKNFTHYLAREAYVYSVPKRDYVSDGRMHVGTKVLLGEIASADVALVCTCTQNGRPINMYVRRDALRERSKGPPPPKDT
jgi:hypothetical protein